MKTSVFARGSNPLVDRAIQRKSLSFCNDEVEARRADWINPNAPEKGIICREFLYFGEKLAPTQPPPPSRSRNCLPSLELPRTQFKDSVTNSAVRQLRLELVVRAEAFARFSTLPSTTLPAHLCA